MKISISEYSVPGFQTLVIEHPNEPELYVTKGAYSTVHIPHRGSVVGDSRRDKDILFDEVNEFISKLPDDKQQELYECYARVDSLFRELDTSEEGDTVETVQTDRILKGIVKTIFSIVKFDDLLFYIKGNRNLRIPPELSNSFRTDDKITNQYIARTYTLNEYMDLMAYCLGLRFMIPIWAPYVNVVGRSAGTVLKEYRAFHLLKGSSIYMTRAVDRLELYIRANINNDDINVAPALHYLSIDEIPAYVIAVTSMRKLSVAPLSADTDSYHLMKIIHSFAMSKIVNLNKALEGGLKNKTGNMYEDDNSSVFCIFKMKEQVSAGDLEYIKLYVSDCVRTAQAIEPSIEPSLVEMCVDRIMGLKKWKAHDIQKGLVAWTMSPVITGTTVPLFNRNTRLQAMAISQAVLWHWGFKELAILITARSEESDPNEFRRRDGKERIPDELMAQLEFINPYKKITTNRSGNTNEAVKGIELFTNQLSEVDWVAQAPIELLREYDKRLNYRDTFSVSSDIRIHLANLLVKLANI